MIRDALVSTVTNKAAAYRTPKVPNKWDMYIFAKKVDKDIPANGRILYINDAKDGSDLEKYFRINSWMDHPRTSSFQFKYLPNKDQVIKMMKENNLNYLVTFNGDLPTYSLTGKDSIHKPGKLFYFNGKDLVVVKQYD